jgi:methionyl-tRNA formyltransferase
MRVVFLGTPEIAVPPLRKLLDQSYEVCGVFTQPDRPSGRGQKLQPSAVKSFANEKGLPIFQPEKIRREENKPIFDALQPDYIIVAAYGQILPDWILRASRQVPINIHFSLLPLYRGAAPVARAILSGDAVTGVTTMVMQEALDSGPILMQREVSIPLAMTTGELTRTLSEIGAELLIQTIEGLQTHAIKPVPQNDAQVSWAPRITKEESQISWSRDALGTHNLIRAMNPWPAAHAIFRGERLNIWHSLPAGSDMVSHGVPGTYLGLSDVGMKVQCGEGTVLELLEIQMPAKRRVSGREFANGTRIRPGEVIFGT